MNHPKPDALTACRSAAASRGCRTAIPGPHLAHPKQPEPTHAMEKWRWASGWPHLDDLLGRNLVDCKTASFSFRWLDLLQEFVGGLGPGERPGPLIPAVDPGLDRGGQVGDGGERATPDGL